MSAQQPSNIARVFDASKSQNNVQNPGHSITCQGIQIPNNCQAAKGTTTADGAGRIWEDAWTELADDLTHSLILLEAWVAEAAVAAAAK